MFRIRRTIRAVTRAVRGVWSPQPRANHVALARAAYEGETTGAVVVLGDSLAERAPWAAILGVPVSNAAYGGMLTREVTGWVPEVLHSDVETVIVWVGTNDALDATLREQVEADLQHLVSTIRDAAPSARIVMLTLPPLGAHAVQVEEHTGVLRGLGVEVADVTDALRSRGLLIGDGIHISGRGYEVVGQIVRHTLARSVE